MFKGDKGGVDGGIRRNFVVVDEWEWRYMIQQTRVNVLNPADGTRTLKIEITYIIS